MEQQYNNEPGGAGISGQQTEEKTPSGVGPFVGAAIIILLLAAGAFYFWSAKSDAVNDNPPPLILGNEEEAAGTSDSEAGLPPQQTSDSPESIESDLKAMNFNQFDSQNDASLQAFQQSTQ